MRKSRCGGHGSDILPHERLGHLLTASANGITLWLSGGSSGVGTIPRHVRCIGLLELLQNPIRRRTVQMECQAQVVVQHRAVASVARGVRCGQRGAQRSLGLQPVVRASAEEGLRHDVMVRRAATAAQRGEHMCPEEWD